MERQQGGWTGITSHKPQLNQFRANIGTTGARNLYAYSCEVTLQTRWGDMTMFNAGQASMRHMNEAISPGIAGTKIGQAQTAP